MTDTSPEGPARPLTNQELRARLAVGLAEAEALREEASRRAAALTSLQIRAMELSAHLEAASETGRRAASDLATAEARNEADRRTIEGLEAELRAQEEALSRLHAALQERSDQIQSMAGELAALEDRNADELRQLAAAHADVLAQSEARQRAELDRIAASQADLLEQAEARRRDGLVAAEQRFEEHDAQLQASQADAQRWRAAAMAAAEALDVQRNDAEAGLAALVAERDAVRAELDRTRRTSTPDVASADALKRLETKIVAARAKLDEAGAVRRALERKIARRDHAISERDGAIARLQMRIERVKASAAERAALVDKEARAAVEAAQVALEASRAETAAQIEEVGRLRRRIGRIKNAAATPAAGSQPDTPTLAGASSSSPEPDIEVLRWRLTKAERERDEALSLVRLLREREAVAKAELRRMQETRILRRAARWRRRFLGQTDTSA